VSEDLKQQLSRDRNLTSDEADRVLDKAAELMAAAEGHGRLSKADLKAGAAEVGIDPRYVEEAFEAVRREAAADKRAAAKKKKRITLAVVVLAALFGATTVVTRLSLGSKMAEVEKRRAQVENVMQRYAQLLPQLERLRQPGAAADPALQNRLADEVSGSLNRVATEKRRYSEAVVAYEHAAGTPPGSWVRPLTGMPAKAPPLTDPR